MQARSAFWTRMPADGQALLDQNATARTGLAGERRIDRYHSSTGARCLVGEDAQERRPPCITDALGEMVVLDHVADLQVFIIHGVVLVHQLERHLVVEVLPLTLHTNLT